MSGPQPSRFAGEAVDTSVAVAAFGEWHELNEPARGMLDQGVALPAHCLWEPTRSSPGSRRRTAPLHRWSSGGSLQVRPDTPRSHPQGAPAADVYPLGGSPARWVGLRRLVALSVLRAEGTLITVDERAATIYDLIGVRWERVLIPPTGALQ